MLDVRKYRLRRNKHGFTMVETSVAFLIFLTVLVLACAVIIASTNLFTVTARRTTEKQIGDGVAQLIEGQLTYVTHLNILTDYGAISTENPVGKAGLRVQDGRLWYSADGNSFSELYGDTFYGGGSYTIAYSVSESPVASGVEEAQDKFIDITVYVYRLDKPAEPVYVTTTTLCLLNMGLDDDYFVQDARTNKQAVNPLLSYDKQSSAS